MHAHLGGASSCQEKCITRLLDKEGVMRINGDQCMYGLRSRDNEHEGLARKGTGFITKFVCIAQKFNKRYPNRQGHQIHRHVRLESGRTRAAQVYPTGLCKAICEGLQEQIAMEEKGQFVIMNVNDTKNATSNGLRQSAEKLKEKYKTVRRWR